MLQDSLISDLWLCLAAGVKILLSISPAILAGILSGYAVEIYLGTKKQGEKK